MTKTRSIHRHLHRRQAAQIDDATQLLRKTIADALLLASLGDGDQASLRVMRAGSATAPAQMAAEQTAADPATRDQIAASYQRCLDSYRSMGLAREDEPDVDDVGRVVAFFVAVNLHALHDVEADAGVLVLLERQLRATARARSNWDAASIEQRQFFFERIAILSVVVSGSRAGAAAQGAQAVANVRHTARQYLEQMLGMNPDWLTLGPAGLQTRVDHGTTAPTTAALPA